MNIGVLLYTYNRIDDAKINMEIIRNYWSKRSALRNVTIVHAFNGEKEWYPKRYLEDDVVRIKNSWHFQGASDLLDAGMARFKKEYPDIDYIIVLAADTWLVEPAYLERMIQTMQKEEKWLATCPWGLPDRNEMADVGIAVDCFILDAQRAHAHDMFPIDYGAFFEKYEDLFLYRAASTVMLEKLLLARYIKAVSRTEASGAFLRKKAFEKILRMTDREPVHTKIDKQGHWIRTMYWPRMGLVTHHDPSPKKEILATYKISGDAVSKLLRTDDLSYFNGGVTTMEGSSN